MSSPYDAIAELYDPWSASVVEDVSFYLEEARRSGAHADIDCPWAGRRDDHGARVALASGVARAARGLGLRGGGVLRLFRPHAVHRLRRLRLDRTARSYNAIVPAIATLSDSTLSTG